jgi:3-hydroxyisobutyrate dehydrogenase-like beta-hydroxyacid dehydrogenase
MPDSMTAVSGEGSGAGAAGMSVGMIGLGDMGTGIATSLLRNGVDLAVCDLRAEAVERLVARGARVAPSLEAVAAECDFALLVVVDDRQVRTVVEALLRTPGRLRTIIISSTVLPETVVDLAATAREKGIEMIDAPVAGGAEKASRGTITVLIGGADETVRRCRSILEAFGGNLFHVGPLGAGSAAKLANNLLSLGGNMLQLEAMQLVGAYGITEDAATEFLAVGTGDSRSLHTWGRLDRVRRSHTLTGSDAIYDIFSKDVKAAALAAGQRGVVLPIAATIGALMAEKMKTRDVDLEARGMTGPIPQCRVCGQELAAPFREAGVHSECAYDPKWQSAH